MSLGGPPEEQLVLLPARSPAEASASVVIKPTVKVPIRRQ